MGSNMMSKNNEIIAAQGEKLHNTMRLWNEAILSVKNGYLQMGQAIHLLKKDKLWRLMGNHIMSFKHFCDKELHISIAQANRLEQIYRELGHVLQDIPIDISKVTLLLPYLHGKTEEEKKDLLIGAKDLNVEDIRNNLKDIDGDGDKATDVCLHLDEIEAWNKCLKCGKYFK